MFDIAPEVEGVKLNTSYGYNCDSMSSRKPLDSLLFRTTTILIGYRKRSDEGIIGYPVFIVLQFLS